jgi:hypothetical protein
MPQIHRKSRNVLVLGVVLVTSAAGCASESASTRPLTFQQRQDRVIADPMNYKPDFSQDDVSAGKLHETNRSGLRRDLNSVFNP